MKTVRAKAFGKLNLYLRVERRREDGYHDLSTLFHSIELADRLLVRERRSTAGEPPATLALVPGRFVKATGATADNLVLRADRLMRERFSGAIPPVAYELEKFIPPGSGLGGGSADAAAVLVALNVLAGLRLESAALAALGAELGSDVAFCVAGGCAVGRGRGEVLRAVASRLRTPIVLARPEIGVSTADAYRACRPEGANETELVDIERAVLSGKSPIVRQKLANSFYNPCLPGYLQIRDVAEILHFWGGSGVLMSGSGSAVFAMFDSPDDADRCAAAIEGKTFWSARTNLGGAGVEIESDSG